MSNKSGDPFSRSPPEAADEAGLLTRAIHVFGTLRTADAGRGLPFRTSHRAGLKAIGAIGRTGSGRSSRCGLRSIFRSKRQSTGAKRESSQSNENLYTAHYFLSIDDRFLIIALNLRTPRPASLATIADAIINAIRRERRL
jgi:hypothetical protein